MTTDSRSTLNVVFKNVVKHSQNFFNHKDMIPQKTVIFYVFFHLSLVQLLCKKSFFFRDTFWGKQVRIEAKNVRRHHSNQKKNLVFFKVNFFFRWFFEILWTEALPEANSQRHLDTSTRNKKNLKNSFLFQTLIRNFW